MADAPITKLNDYVQVNLVGRYHQQTCILTHHFKFEEEEAVGVTIGLDVVAAHFLTQFWTKVGNWYRDVMASTFQLQAVTAQVVSPIRSIAWPAIPQVGSEGGALVGASLPSGVAAVLRRRGNIGDRHNYGRVYVPALPVTFVADSSLTTTAMNGYTLTAISFSVEQVIPGTGGNGTFTPRIYNKAAPGTSRLVTHGVVDKIVRYQRRREVGVGI